MLVQLVEYDSGTPYFFSIIFSKDRSGKLFVAILTSFNIRVVSAEDDKENSSAVANNVI
jgi:hypothetical protein